MITIKHQGKGGLSFQDYVFILSTYKQKITERKEELESSRDLTQKRFLSAEIKQLKREKLIYEYNLGLKENKIPFMPLDIPDATIGNHSEEDLISGVSANEKKQDHLSKFYQNFLKF